MSSPSLTRRRPAAGPAPPPPPPAPPRRPPASWPPRPAPTTWRRGPPPAGAGWAGPNRSGPASPSPSRPPRGPGSPQERQDGDTPGLNPPPPSPAAGSPCSATEMDGRTDQALVVWNIQNNLLKSTSSKSSDQWNVIKNLSKLILTEAKTHLNSKVFVK